LATGVDTARAETRIAQDRQRLIQGRLAATQADIRLKRVVGISLSEPVALSSGALQASAAVPQESSAIAQAISGRAEIRMTQEQLKAETDGLAAARANFLPVISAQADYGFSGNLRMARRERAVLGDGLIFQFSAAVKPTARLKKPKDDGAPRRAVLRIAGFKSKKMCVWLC